MLENEYKNEVRDSIPFTQIPNEVIEDENLDWSAKGMYAYLMSKPTGWVFYETEIAKHSPKGVSATKGPILKLIEAGYLRRYKKKNADGKFCGWVYELKNRYSKKPIVDFSDVGKTHTNNTNSSNTNNSNNKTLPKGNGLKPELEKIDNKIEVYGKNEINECLEYWESVVGYKISGRIKQNRWAVNNLLKKYSQEEVFTLVRAVGEAQKDKFGPRIEDFSALQSKLNKLMVWVRQQNGVKKHTEIV